MRRRKNTRDERSQGRGKDQQSWIGNNAAGRGRNKNMSYQANAISRVNWEIKGEAYAALNASELDADAIATL